MKYQDLADTDGFHRNMRKTPFLKLFPHWWDEQDPLINAIGDEVERIKALAIFGLLNAGIKPPVLLWQTSLTHDVYNVNKDITELPAIIEIEPTLYKTWGEITLTNNTTDDIDGLEITFDGTNGFAINQLISQNDVIKIDLTENKVQINNHTIKPQTIGQGMPHFITSQRNSEHKEGTPLNNEVIRLKITTDTNLEDTIVSKTINVSENIEDWEVNGKAYKYNKKGADPWIALENGRIGYEINLDGITNISFIYKADIPSGESCTLNCYIGDKTIFSKNVTSTFTDYIIDEEMLESIKREMIGVRALEFEHNDAGTVYINEIKYKKESKYGVECDINVDINMNNAVFINEQNIEVTGLELIPIERIELYANYDFEYNKKRNGWQKVYQKKYDKKTNVVYDMVTTHFITKEFYVDVWFKTLQYPYRVGFPCYQAAESDSMFHVNNRLDTLGETLGLDRRLYRTNIPEEEYYHTFPEYYPFDIEQDYWYYKRLVNEYTWNDLAINSVDIKDTEGNDVVRLYSINPFCEDFVVHAKSRYPQDKQFVDYNEYYPILIMQQDNGNYKTQTSYSNIINLLGHNNYTSSITLNNNSSNNDVVYKKNLNTYDQLNLDVDINNLSEDDKAYVKARTRADREYRDNYSYMSKELVTFFNLSDLPENINIDDITITIEAESTDNKTNKFNTDRTGLIVPGLRENEESTFIPLTTEESYQLSKKSITYRISDTTTLQKIASDVDENILQEATIGAFEGKLGRPVRIPFTLKENNIEVTDITDVYIYYDGGTFQSGAMIEKDEDGKQYIHTVIPKRAMFDKINIECKTATHMPFSTSINIAKATKYKEEDGKQVEDYEYVYGPLIDGKSENIIVQEEWHTKDIRNVLQRQGVYFRNVFQNNDEQSSTTIILYNIKLEVHYSQKDSSFELETYVNVKDAVKPCAGIYEILIKNTGDKPLKTCVDIITPPNITLEKNYIDVDLNVGAYIKEEIKITPEYPIVDGTYDIVAICNDTIKRNSINIFADGLIQTSVDLKPHNGKYNENITLSATVNAIDNSKINGNGNEVQFYINDFAVGPSVPVYNNKAQITITPGNYNFTGTGTLPLEARYLGSSKYASSRSKTSIFISKNNTRITIISPPQAIYKHTCEMQAIVEYFNGEKYKPVDEGHVTFYVGNEIFGSSSTCSNGKFTVSINQVENPPNEYILKARYEGSNIYSATEAVQDFEIIGGDVEILVFDEKSKPYDKINLKAKVVDINNKPIPSGYLNFTCEELNKEFTNIEIKNGIGSTPYFDIQMSLEDDETKMIPFKVVYHNALDTEDEIYNDGEETGYIIVKKSNAIIEYSSLYQASQYEPLGFIIKVKDAETNEYVSEGTVKITLPSQNNLSIQGKVDENGTARLVHNLINFTAKEWQQLNKWSFTTDNYNDNEEISKINNPDINDYDGVYNPENLYKIYDGDYTDITLVDFELSEDGKYLQYVGKSDNEKEVNEYVFIGDDGCLYAQTDIDELRKYTTGLQNIKIEFISDGGYKSRTINVTNGLNIEPQKVDLDIHSYDLTYTSKDGIICYVTKYDSEEINTPITDGHVQFIFDDKLIDTVSVVDGLAIFQNDALMNIPAGKHLLEVDYIKDNQKTTRSFSLFNLEKSVPTISMDVNRVVRNKNSRITVTLSSEKSLDIPLNGMVTLYLNDEVIGEQYLYGNENIMGLVNYEDAVTEEMMNNNPYLIFNYVMPDDVNTPDKYTLKATYEGNDFYTPATPAIKHICEEPSLVTITSQDVNIETDINIAVNEECSIDFIIESEDDIIDEGVLYLIAGTDIVAQDTVSNNTATLKWIPSTKKLYTYEIKYDKATHYKSKTQTIRFNSIEGLDTINLPNDSYTFKQALMCLKTNGTIILNEDITLNKSLTIQKDCNIIGTNDVSVHASEPIEIINDSHTHIENVHFTSTNSLSIINNNYLVINHSILDENIKLHNNDYLMAQRNFIYGTCSGSSADLNNNWWGSNTPPYKVQNHIIIEVEPNNSPAVISEEVDIIGRMIGSNGREYSLPEADFTFGADTGYFSIDFGKTVNHKAQTTYLDGEKEGKIYFSVDNETVSCYVYSYERKTEIIIEDIPELPMGYQVPIKAYVQSIADSFYKFNKNNDVIQSTEPINNGHILFYLNDKQVGYSPVTNGEAQTVVFLTNKYYSQGQYTLTAEYQPNEYFFSSKNSTKVQIIDSKNACYVSSSGDNSNEGTFASPYKTIKHAITESNTIYLLDEYYNEKEITITQNTTIKSFKNNTKFYSLEGQCIFNIGEEISLSLYGIDFSNNLTNTLFNNKGTLNIEQCILYKNKNVFTNEGSINVRYSAIVDNEQIATTITPSWFVYCWFGKNNPDITGIDNYVQMSKKASKDILYIGTIAHVTGLLDTYKHGMLTYKLDKKLPLRIAKFATTYGSMMPIKDYTYNNQSTSLLNTQEDNNTNKYIISIPDNTNYIEHQAILKCNVITVHGDNATGKVFMNVIGDKTTIEKDIILKDGEALLKAGKLNEGRYILKCTYENDNNNAIQTYTATSSFIVKKPEIIAKKFNIVSESNLYYATLDIELTDNFDNNINDEKIKIYIDDNYITSATVKNGKIYTKITYNKIPSGQHTMTITDLDSQKYSAFTQNKYFNTKEKDVQILFPYTGFEANVHNKISIDIVDDENVKVEGGSISIAVDNEIVVPNTEVIDGNVTISNFSIQDIGQHSIIIHYTGLDGYYNETAFINNYISVGIFNVIFGLNEGEYVHTDIGQYFNFSTTVRDVGNQLVNQGYINIYIDDILLNDLPIYVNDGEASIQTDLPTNISYGTYNLKIEYIDSSNKYLDTLLYTFLQVGKIQTNINVDPIRGAPGQNKVVSYQISTTYESAKSGTLIAKYDGDIIGKSAVTEDITNQIVIKVPFVPDTSDYVIDFEYSDETTYADSSTSTKLIIDKNYVNIEPSHTSYYPNKNFHFVATILDKDGNRVNTGKASLYIDGVQETESQDVINGQFVTSLIFNKARSYSMNIIYEENDYYEKTPYEFTLKIDSVDIDKISFKDDITNKPLYYVEDNKIYSLPNQLIKAELVFTTLDNYNVKDGIIDIKIDGNTIASYYIAESNKYIDFNVGNISKGNHSLEIEYHDSNVFNNYPKEPLQIPLTILSKQSIIKANNGEAIVTYDHKDSIDISTVIYDAKTNEPIDIDGMLKYYIGLPIYKNDIVNSSIVDEYDYRFIGVEPISQSAHTYSYTLPTELLEYAIDKYETHYKIKVDFTGNEEYDGSSDIIDLQINKQDCSLNILDEGPIEVNYRDTIEINFNIDAEGSPLVNFYIDNDLIGSVITENKKGTLKYKLGSKYTVKEGSDYYTLKASFAGSAINRPAESSVQMHVHQLMPTMDSEDMIAYYGGKLTLDNVLTDVDGTVITDGTLSYTIGENERTFDVNTIGTIDIPETTADTLVLNVKYDTTNANYMVFEKDINVHLKPNDILLNINAPNEIYRGETYNINISATSETTTLPIDLIFNDECTMTNGSATIPITLPATTPYKQSHDFVIASAGNQFFNPIEQTITTKIINYNEITLNIDEETNKTNAQTLEKAIDLVAEYGIIKVIKAQNEEETPEPQQITINKSVNIIGENVAVKKWEITNNANEVSINGIIFNNSIESAIVNNGEITIGECQFNAGTNSAIYTSGNVNVQKCTFTGNTAHDGAGIYISNRNYKAVINECVFTQNNATGNGSCIYSNRGNDVDILNSRFNNNLGTSGVTSSICANGNIYLSSNSFYNNPYECEIYLINGTLSAENNLFDGSIQSIKSYNGMIIDVDFNYWGYNNIETIESKNSDLLTINNWLISSRHDYKQEIDGNTKSIIVGTIEQYQNRLEKEIKTMTPVDIKFPVIVGGSMFYLNDKVQATPSAIVKIGQETFGGTQ